MYVATINVPGYLPMDDDPPEFDTAVDAWDWLANEREQAEDECEEYETGDPDQSEYTECLQALRALGRGAPDECEWDMAADLTGTVYGHTPGRRNSPHDLGLAYCVTAVPPVPGQLTLDV